MKGGRSRELQQEFPEVKVSIGVSVFFAMDYGYCSTENITDKMVNDYLERQKIKRSESGNFILDIIMKQLSIET